MSMPKASAATETDILRISQTAVLLDTCESKTRAGCVLAFLIEYLGTITSVKPAVRSSYLNVQMMDNTI